MSSTKSKRTGDFLLYDIPQVCREVVTLVNETTETQTLTSEEIIGQPVGASRTSGCYVLLATADVSLTTGFLVSGPALSLLASSSIANKYVAVTLAPVTFDKDQFAAEDYAGAAFDADELETYAFALGMRCAVEPVETSIQTE